MIFGEEKDKQIFISLDQIPSYDEIVKKIITVHQVLKLLIEHPLYGNPCTNNRCMHRPLLM